MAHVVWPTRILEGGEQTIGLFHAMTGDGRRFTARQRLDTAGVPHHPHLVASGAGTVAVVWDESLAGRRQVILASGKIGPDGRPRLKRAVLSADTSGSYPDVALSGPTVVVAWTSHVPGQSVIRVARIPAP
jgi:outer membrane protein assembly factor BamB